MWPSNPSENFRETETEAEAEVATQASELQQSAKYPIAKFPPGSVEAAVEAAIKSHAIHEPRESNSNYSACRRPRLPKEI